MPDTRMVVIRHPKTGMEYAIDPKDFTRDSVHPKGTGSYATQGYVIERYEDGSAYDGPKSKREIDKTTEERQAKREATASKAPAAEKGKATS